MAESGSYTCLVLANTGLDALGKVLDALLVLEVTIWLLLVLSTVILLVRHPRPGFVTVLAVADVVLGILGLGAAVLFSVWPTWAVGLLALPALGLVVAGWKLLWMEDAPGPNRKASSASSDDGFWKQFD